MSAAYILDGVEGLDAPVTVLIKLMSAGGVSVNKWWNGGTSFLPDGSMSFIPDPSTNVVTAYQGSMLSSWLADQPTGLPLGQYRAYFYALDTPDLTQRPVGTADFDSETGADIDGIGFPQALRAILAGLFAGKTTLTSVAGGSTILTVFAGDGVTVAAIITYDKFGNALSRSIGA